MKRVIAWMIVLAMMVTSNYYGNYKEVQASETSVSGEWSLYSNISGGAFWRNGSNGFEIIKNDAAVDLPATALKENLELYIKLSINDDEALTSIQNGVVEIAQTTCDQSELCWGLEGYELQVGVNEIRLKLSEAISTEGESGPFQLDETIKYFRLYSTTDAGAGTATLYEVKLIDTTISVSEKQVEWTLLPAGAALNAAIENGQTDNVMYGLSAETGTVETGEIGPKVGTTYSKTIASAYDETTGTGGRMGFNPGWQGSLGMKKVVIPDTYTQEELKLAFWLYSSTGDYLPGGAIGLASGGWNNADEIRWVVGGIPMRQGWNYIELDLNDYDYSWGEFDYQNINYIHWYTDGYLNKETEYRLTDIKLVATYEEPSYLVGEIPFVMDKTFQATGGDAFSIGANTVFDAIDVSGRDTTKLQLLMDVEVENLTNPGNLSDIAKFSGQLELTSSGTCDVEEISAMVSAINWRDGKYEYAINLATMSGSINYENINYMRLYIMFAEGVTTDQFHIKIDNVRLVDTTGKRTILPTVFSNGALFQQNKPMNLWGYGTAGDAVSAKLYKGEELLETQNTITSANGEWNLAFTAREGSYDAYTIDVTVGETNQIIRDVLVGELWIAGGQSNMELWVWKDMKAQEIIEEADNPNIRMFLEPIYPYGQTGTQPINPADDVPGAYWGYGSNGLHVSNTSSLAYTFAKNLQEKLDVPVGIINSAIGGTIIEGWLSREAIESDAVVKSAIQAYGLYYTEENWPETAGSMSTLYNQKIGPLEGMNIAGVIWYQGESNSDRSDIYDIEIDLLKRSWGEAFGFANGDMPFIFTQVAPYRTDNGMQNQQHFGYLAMYMERGWKLSEDKNTAMLTIYDLPLDHAKDGVSYHPIHPREKTPIGERFYEAAYNMVYGGGKEYTAPVYESMEIKDNAIYITLDHVGEGLQVIDGTDDVHGFTIAGEDGVYVNAQAKIIDQDTVMVWNDRVAEPKNAMYAFDNFNQGANLANSEDIPASPFRTVQFDDTTFKPDASLNYFTAQDWMYADKDVWVYDSTYTEDANMCTGFRPSFAVSGGTYSYDADVKREGTASLKVAYEDDFNVSPILSYESVKQDWSAYKYLTVYMQNEDAVNVTMTIQSGGKDYVVSTEKGSYDSFTEVTFDLTKMTLDGAAVEDTVAVLAGLTGMTFQVDTEKAGVMYFDAFSVGMTEKANVIQSEPRIILYQEGYQPGTAPADANEYREEGYIFAGWFVDEACTQALTKTNVKETEKAYAKYVDEKVLGVKAQVSANLTDNSAENDDEGSIRFVTTVDSLNYKKVGFVLRIGDVEVTVGSNKVYKVLYAVSDSLTKWEEYHPDTEFSAQSKYFKTFTLTGFKKDGAKFNYDTEVTVTPYWVTQDGTTVYGDSEVKSIRMGLAD